MGDGVDEAAIDEREPVGVEGGGDRNAVRAIAVEKAGRGAVEGMILAVKERDRNRLAVGGRREQPSRDVIGGVVAARDFLALAQTCVRASQDRSPRLRTASSSRNR